MKLPTLLLLVFLPSWEQVVTTAPITTLPKHYDAAAMQSVAVAVQASVAKISRDLDAFRLEVDAYHLRMIKPLNERLGTLTNEVKMLQDRVDSLDITQDDRKLTQIEDWVKAQQADQLKREATSKSEYDTMMSILKPIAVGLGMLILHAGWRLIWKSKFAQTLTDVKSDTHEIKEQTNGMNERLRAEVERLKAEMEFRSLNG